MSDQPAPSIEERLAILEERTAPQRKGLLEIIKEWSGFATAIIALLYSFPLGIWDYWVTSPQTAELEALRNATTQLAELEARQTQGYAAITAPELRIFYANAMGAQRAAVLARVEPLIQRRQADLSVQELIMLAYNLAQYGLPDRALATYSIARETAERDRAPLPMRADIYRMIAAVHLNQGPGGNPDAVRHNYSQNITLLLSSPTPWNVQMAANTGFEWAFFEKTAPAGNWACGEFLHAWALHRMQPLAAVNPGAANLLEAHRARFAPLPTPPEEARSACPLALANTVSAR